MEVQLTAAAGPLGLALLSSNEVDKITPGGQAANAGVQPGDVLVMVAETDVRGLEHDDVLGLIRGAERPVVLTFARNQPVAQQASSSSKAAASQAAKKAGSLMKGIITAGVKVVQAVDKIVDKAVQDSASQAKAAAAKASVQRRLGGDGGIDLRALVPREVGAFQLHDEDSAFEACQEYVKQSEEKIHELRCNNADAMRLTEEIDLEVHLAKERILTAQAELSSLTKALNTHIPSIAADAAQLAVVAGTLQENFVALESRMFALLLSKAVAEQDAWASQQAASSDDYASAKGELLARAGLDNHLASRLLAYEDEQIALLAAAAAAAASAASSDSKADDGGALAASPAPRRLPSDFPAAARSVAAMAASLDAAIKRNIHGTAHAMSKLNTFVGGLGSGYTVSSSRREAAQSNAGADSGPSDNAGDDDGDAGDSPDAALPPSADAASSVAHDIPAFVKVKDVAKRLQEQTAEERERLEKEKEKNRPQPGRLNIVEKFPLAAAASSSSSHAAGEGGAAADSEALTSSQSPVASPVPASANEEKKVKVGGRVAALASKFADKNKAGSAVKLKQESTESAVDAEP